MDAVAELKLRSNKLRVNVQPHSGIKQKRHDPKRIMPFDFWLPEPNGNGHREELFHSSSLERS